MTAIPVLPRADNGCFDIYDDLPCVREPMPAVDVRCIRKHCIPDALVAEVGVLPYTAVPRVFVCMCCGRLLRDRYSVQPRCPLCLRAAHSPPPYIVVGHASALAATLWYQVALGLTTIGSRDCIIADFCVRQRIDGKARVFFPNNRYHNHPYAIPFTMVNAGVVTVVLSTRDYAIPLPH